MGKDSAIEWTRHTFNPWHGCVEVSPGCEHCYAKRYSKRSGKNYWGATANRRWMSDKYWNDPLRWNKNSPGRVFCGSMCDVFEIHKDPIVRDLMDAERIRLWRLIEATPNLEWLLLTKRIDNVARNMNIRALLEGTLKNVRLGISVCTQEEADRDIPKLLSLNVPNFLSIEPLLEEVDLGNWLCKAWSEGGYTLGTYLDWVIVGGESGPNARPMHPGWVRSIRDDCRSEKVPFFFKQWGEYWPHGQGCASFLDDLNKDFDHPDIYLGENGFAFKEDEAAENIPNNIAAFYKVGKKKAGSLLDGQEWKEFPYG